MIRPPNPDERCICGRDAVGAYFDPDVTLPTPFCDHRFHGHGPGDMCPHESATGIDTTRGPDKVWRCDVCGWLFRWTTTGPVGATGPRPPRSDWVGWKVTCTNGDELAVDHPADPADSIHHTLIEAEEAALACDCHLGGHQIDLLVGADLAEAVNW